MDEQQPRHSFSGGPRQMFDTTCTACGNKCQVPFQPKEGKPVYCRDCFAKHKPPRRDF